MNFLNGKYSVSDNIVGHLFVCLSVVGLVVRCWNRFIFAERIFLLCCF